MEGIEKELIEKGFVTATSGTAHEGVLLTLFRRMKADGHAVQIERVFSGDWKDLSVSLYHVRTCRVCTGGV